MNYRVSFQQENDRADKVASSTINLTTEKKFKIPYTYFKMKINKHILQQRQQRWNDNENDKLLEIKPTLGEWKQSFRKKGKEEITDRSNKDNSFLFTRRKTTTNMLCMPDKIHREAHFYRMYQPSPYKKNLL